MDADRSFADVPIDSVRDFWNARPCNIRHSPREVGTREYFDEVERRKYFVEPHIPGFAEFERWKDRKVLEIGCGTRNGHGQFRARRRACHGGRAVGEVGGAGTAARRGLRARRSRHDSRRQRRGAPDARPAADLRSGLFVRRDSPLSAPAPHHRARHALHGTGERAAPDGVRAGQLQALLDHEGREHLGHEPDRRA